MNEAPPTAATPDADPAPDTAPLPQPVARRHAPDALWLVWLVPLAAVVIGLALGVHAILARGPTVTIFFHNAEGVEAGKTHIKYKDVDIGVVQRVRLTADHRAVEVSAEMHGNEGLEDLLVSDTRFWVVRPRVGAAGVTGLTTLLSGAYIALDVGHSSEATRQFQGLDMQPTVTADVPGREFVLESDQLGSLDIGSQLYLRRVPVGQVMAYQLSPDGRSVQFHVFVAAPYDRFVSATTRFWHASGLDVDFGADGLHVDMQSVASVIAGGIAFQDLPDVDPAKVQEAGSGTRFRLYPDRTEALRLPDSRSYDYRLLFASSVRGLAIGAPVDFRGLPIGEVTGIGVQGLGGRESPEPLIAVDIRVYPSRLPTVNRRPHEDKSKSEQRLRLDPMIERGLRAQLRTGNLLTGQYYVALDFFPKAAAAHIDWRATPPLLPTVQGSFDTLQDLLTDLAQKLDRLPLDDIAQDLRHTLGGIDRTVARTDQLLAHVDQDVTPEARATLADARRTLEDLRRTLDKFDGSVTPQATQALQDIGRTAQSLRGLADYLERHPESLVRGKPEDTP